jgi:hypothetical protein
MRLKAVSVGTGKRHTLERTRGRRYAVDALAPGDGLLQYPPRSAHRLDRRRRQLDRRRVARDGDDIGHGKAPAVDAYRHAGEAVTECRRPITPSTRARAARSRG